LSAVSDPLRPREGAALRGALRVAPLDASHRARVEEILRATSVFRGEEVDVALELFDLVYAASDGTAIGGAGAVEPDYTFVGVFAGEDRLLGYACYGPTPATDRTYDLYWIAVDPAAQGSGAGTRLLAEVERRLCDARGRMLVVETSSRDEYDATRGFYAARGYQEAARVGHFYAPGDDRVIYTKRLSAVSARLSASEAVETPQPRVESIVPDPSFGLGATSLTSTTSPDGRGAAAQ
jgi:ribosomal protein S18 acetylase RimI-like enzyme